MRSVSLTTRAFVPLAIIMFTLAGVLTYAKIFDHGFVDWDDGYLIIENADVHDITPATIRSVFTRFDPELYVPLTFLSLQLDYWLGGGQPLMFHLTNLALHIANALLVVWIITLLSGWRMIGIITGALFLVHPINTEVVAWASARKDALSAALFLGSLISYVHYVRVRNQKPETRSQTHYAVSILFCLLGLLAKVTVAVLPVVLLLIDRLEGRKLSRDVLREKLPYFFLAFVFIVIALFGKQHVVATLGFGDQLIVAMRAASFQMQRLLFPHGFAALHVAPEPIGLFALPYISSLLIILTLGIATFRVQHRTPILVFALIFSAVTFVPSVLNIARDYEVIMTYDRYAYLPSIGIFMAVAVGCAWAYGKMRGRSQLLFSFGMIAVCCWLAVFSTQQAHTWRDTESLLSHALAHYPHSTRVRHRLGVEYLVQAQRLQENGQLREAADTLHLALAFHAQPAVIHSNLGAVYGRMHQPAREEAAYQAALRANPDFLVARYNLARLYEEQGRPAQALAQYQLISGHDQQFLDAAQRAEIVAGSL